MLSKQDAENIFDRVADKGLDWEFWQDKGSSNIWVSTDGEWLIQIGYCKNVIVLNHKEPDSDKQVAVWIPYKEDQSGIKLLIAATVNPHKTHTSLRETPATRVITCHISIE